VGDANAYAVGHDAQDAHVVVTAPLVELLSARELKGVLAHEVAHIKNEDVRLTGRADTLARMSALLRRVLLAPTGVMTYGQAARKLLPLAVVTGLSILDLNLLSHLNSNSHGIATLAKGLALAAAGLVLLVGYVFAFGYAGRADLFIPILLGMSVVLPLGLLLSNPFVAGVVAAQVSQVREYQADADAVSYTGEPFSLSSALSKLAGIGQSEIISRLAGIRYALFIAPDVRAGVLSVRTRLLATHPPPEKRIEALNRLGGVDTALAQKADRSPIPPQQEGSR
jgi:Zn-dependent protease with chaperone function